MSDEDYDQGFAEGYYHGLSTDKETSFLILAARIDKLKKENEKLRDMLLRSDKLTRQEWYDMREKQLAEEANAAALKEQTDE